MVDSGENGGEVNGVLTPKSASLNAPGILSSSKRWVQSPGILQKIGSILDQGCSLGENDAVATPEGTKKGDVVCEYSTPPGPSNSPGDKADQENRQTPSNVADSDDDDTYTTPPQYDCMMEKDKIPVYTPMSISSSEKNGADESIQGSTESEDTESPSEHASEPADSLSQEQEIYQSVGDVKNNTFRNTITTPSTSPEDIVEEEKWPTPSNNVHRKGDKIIATAPEDPLAVGKCSMSARTSVSSSSQGKNFSNQLNTSGSESHGIQEHVPNTDARLPEKLIDSQSEEESKKENSTSPKRSTTRESGSASRGQRMVEETTVSVCTPVATSHVEDATCHSQQESPESIDEHSSPMQSCKLQDEQIDEKSTINPFVPPETPMDVKLMKDEDAAFLPEEFKKQLLYQAEPRVKDDAIEVQAFLSCGNNVTVDQEIRARIADVVEGAEPRGCINETDGEPPVNHDEPEPEAASNCAISMSLDRKIKVRTEYGEGSQKKIFTLLEMQARVADAVEEAEQQWKVVTEAKVEAAKKETARQLQKEAEQQLIEHGSQWMSEHEEEVSKLKAGLDQRLEEERKRSEHAKEKASSLQREEFMRDRQNLLIKISSLESSVELTRMEQEKKTQVLLQEHEEELKVRAEELENALELQKMEMNERIQSSVAEIESRKQVEIDQQNEIIRQREKDLENARAEMLSTKLEQEEKIVSVKQSLDERILEIKTQEDAIKALREEMEEKLRTQKLEFECEVTAQTQQQKIDFDTALRELKEQHNNELETQRVLHQKAQEGLEIQLEQMKREAVDNAQARSLATEEGLKNLREIHQQEMQKVVESHEKEISNWEKRMQTLKEDFEIKIEKQRKEMETMSSGEKEEQLRAELEECKTKSENDLQRYEHELKRIRDGHSSEIDDMLAQLDLVEVEHNQRYQENARAVSEKEAIISALGSQLAEASTKVKSLDADLCKQLEIANEAKEEAAIAQRAVHASERKIERLCAEHKKALETERKERLTACDQVKEEMIAAAEEQFGRANETYLNLKHDYESSKSKLARLERDIVAARKEADVCRKEQAARDVEASAEVAQLKASLASCEANIARKAQSQRREVESLKISESEMRAKLDEATSNCSTAHMSLATVVAEKERLTKELAEMKSVCEELMAMVEGTQ